MMNLCLKRKMMVGHTPVRAVNVESLHRQINA